MRNHPSDARAVHLAILAIPFIVMVIALAGLSRSVPVFQSGDERIHFDIVRQFALQWPRPVLWGYAAWSGPLVYWLLAALSLPLGGSLAITRLAVAVLSWATCAIAYHLLRDRLKARPKDALALALVLALSPFFFSQAFRVLTDNPTWLFVVAALDCLLAYALDPRTGRLVAFAVLAGAATLMRQFSAWLFVPAAAALVGSRPARPRLAAGIAALCAGLLPLVLLAALWGGLLPRGSTAGGMGYPPALSNLLLSLAVVGVYGVLLVPAKELARLPHRLGRRMGLIAVAAMASAEVALAAGALRDVVGRDPYSLGWLSFAGRHYPGPQGTSLLLWILVPTGVGVAVALVSTRLHTAVDRVLVASLLGLLAATMIGPAWYQRYVDFPALLLLSGLAVASGVELGTADRLRWLVVVAVSAAWMVALFKVG